MSLSRLLSLVVAGFYLIFWLVGCLTGELAGGFKGGAGSESLKTLFGLLGYLALPLACIWFGDEMGEWTGTMRLHQITSSSPGNIVAFMGWILLLLPVIVACYYRCYYDGNWM